MVRTENSLPLQLRSEPAALSEDDVKTMLDKYDFFDHAMQWWGKGIQHLYEPKEISGDPVVIDNATGLMWEQSGAEELNYPDAKDHIVEMNKKGYAGFKDWRLPTLEEAMSLVEPTKQDNGLHISTHFDSKQLWIWTADFSPSCAWDVDFEIGVCTFGAMGFSFYVRAIRSR